MDRPCVLYHAVGGGLGHAVRGLALARQMARRTAGRHVVFVNTPFISAIEPFVHDEPGLELVAMHSLGAAEVAGYVQAKVREFCPDLFVVDTFPRGVGNELVRLLEGWSGCPRVLIARTLRADGGEHDRLRSFAQRHYDLILGAGESSPFAGLAKHEMLPPFLIRDLDELPARAEALALLQADRPVVLVVGSGSFDECGEWRSEAAALAAGWPADAPPLRLALPPGLDLRARSGLRLVRHFPLIDCLPGVRLVVGNAGYHLVHEARAMGVARLFRARQRKFDDQAGRLRAGEELIGDALPAVLARWREPAPLPAGLPNGAALAAQRIAEQPWFRC
jgi:hypothetical protein